MTLAMSKGSERGLLRHLAYLAEASVLLRILDSHGIRHVHVHFGTNAADVARLIHCLGGPTYSMTIHAVEFEAPLGFSLAEKTADATFVVAISEYCRAQLHRWVASHEWEKIHVVRCSVNEDFLEPLAPIDGSSRILLCIGRFSPEKGQLLLLDTMKLLIADKPEARLYWLVMATNGH